MKTQLKILIALLVLLPITASADYDFDNGLKRQCQYEVYGNGSKNSLLNMYMIGIITGIDYMIDYQDKTKFSLNSNNEVLLNKACQNALNDISSNGFLYDFKGQAYKLMKKR